MVSQYLRPIAILVMLDPCGSPTPLQAQDQTLRDMHHASWTAREGAPQGIHHLAQDPDGSLWVGSESGLFNFDGETFHPFRSPPSEPELPAGDVHSLLVTKNGTLWVSFYNAALARVLAGRVTLYDTVDGEPIRSVEQLREAPNGSIWAIDGRQRLIRFDSDSGWRAEPLPGSAPIAGIFVDSADTLWLAQDGFLYTRSLHQSSYARTEVRADVITGFAETPSGEIWMNDHDAVTSAARMQQISPAGRLIGTHAQGLPESGAMASLADGSLIVTSLVSGVRRLSERELSLLSNTRDASPDTFALADGLASSATRAAFVDAHGNIWIASALGLDRLRPNQLPRFLPEEDKGNWGMCSTNRGDTLFTNQGGELYSASQDPPIRLPGTAIDLVSFTCTDVNRVWFVDRRGGIWSIIDGNVTALPPLAGPRQRDVIRLVAASDHTLYATVSGTFETGGGVWRFTDNRWTKLQSDGELNMGGYSAYVDHRDRLWIGYNEGRVILHNANDARMLSSGNPGLGYVHSFLDTSHGMLAAGTNGLAVLRDARFEMLAYADPSLVRGVRGMVEARNGDLWLNSVNGFAQLAAAEIKAAIANPTYPMKVKLVREGDFAIASGPHSFRVTYWNTAARDSKGHLWFAIRGTKRGELVRLDPERPRPTAHPPRLTIRSIAGDGRPLTTGVVAPATRALAIQYFGVNLTEPESVVYRYRLEGFDDTWQEAGRRTEAVYTTVPPGTYTFSVIASSRDGIWTEPVSTVVTVLPSFHQTWWFAVAMLALATLLVGVLHRARVRQLSRAMSARFDERLAERTRLARELHDTLLQTVHGSKLVADRALRDTGDRDQLVRALEQLSGWLAQAANEGRAALHSLRTSTTETNNLAGAFRRAIDECRNNSHADVALVVHGDTQQIHPVVRDEVYRIGYEAIRNACEHSRAHRIDVVLEYGHDLTLRISDNGVGIDGEVIKTGREGHFGLRGMRERAERIGAKLTLASGPTGTVVTLIVPGNTGFARSDRLT